MSSTYDILLEGSAQTSFPAANQAHGSAGAACGVRGVEEASPSAVARREQENGVVDDRLPSLSGYAGGVNRFQSRAARLNAARYD
jgi:hypothetical protein